MELSRRKFFRGGAGAVVGLSLGAAACAPPAQSRALGDLSDLDQHTFTAHLGSTFQLVSGPAPFTELRLAAVEDYAATHPASVAGEVFSVFFLGPAELVLPQELYRLEHPLLGAMSLLLVPKGPSDEGRLYEAVFNRRLG